MTTGPENIKIRKHIVVKPINVRTLNLVQYLKIDSYKRNAVYLTLAKKALSHFFYAVVF